MPRIRTLAMVAVAMGGTLVGSPIHACDNPASPTCQQGAPAEAAAVDGRPTKAQRGQRTKHERHIDPASHNEPFLNVVASPPSNLTALSVATPSDKDTAIAALPFQLFVSKQPIATGTAEELRSPKLETALFAAENVYPVGGGIIAQTDDEAAMVSQARNSDAAHNFKLTSNEVAPDSHIDLNDEAPRAAGERRMAPPQARSSDNGASSVSWVALAFLVWGGLLTVGSGLRLIFG